MDVNKENIGQYWHDWFMTDAFAVEKKVQRFFSVLPHDPRCKMCNSPFEGVGGMVVGAFFGRKPSSLNPHFCNVCEAFAQKFPGGAEVEMSMLFVDVRGSTALSEQMPPIEFKKIINRFYIEATNAIVGEDGLVEKLAGDSVAAFWGAGFAGQDYVARTIVKWMESSKYHHGRHQWLEEHIGPLEETVNETPFTLDLYLPIAV